MILEFPSRRWFRTERGWTSREPTPDDIEERRDLDREWQERREEQRKALKEREGV